MPARPRAALTPVQISIPITSGAPVFGWFQSLYLFEHRGGEHRRELVLYLVGE